MAFSNTRTVRKRNYYNVIHTSWSESSSTLDFTSPFSRVEVDGRIVSPELRNSNNLKHHNLGVYMSSLAAPDFRELVILRTSRQC